MNTFFDPTRVHYVEDHRPQVHFSPAKNWMNDPNGMVYFEGTYHLFYQYSPNDNVWADIHWGHATSTDLLRWEHKPIALHSDLEGLGMVFSGCAVVDWQNTSGFGINGKPPLVAIFTHSSDTGNQVQSLAYSTNAGEHWAMYEVNPVLENHEIVDFRDPKVFWDARYQHWVMVLAAGSFIQFYRSKNLRDWAHFNDFGHGLGEQSGVWECPDLFPLSIEGEQKWVLLVSVNAGGPNGGSATQYFIGDFDGERFDVVTEETLWLDCGPDNYAGVSWSDIPDSDGRRIMIGWMSNWRYACLAPTEPWRGAMTLPRELMLIETDQGLRLACSPIKELELLRKTEPLIHKQLRIGEAFLLNQQCLLEGPLDIVMSVDISRSAAWQLRFFNELGGEFSIDFDVSGKEVRARRHKAAHEIDVESGFLAEIRAPINISNYRVLSFRVIKDASSIELFSNAGESLITATFFSERALTKLEITPLDGAELVIQDIVVYELARIWS